MTGLAAVFLSSFRSLGPIYRCLSGAKVDCRLCEITELLRKKHFANIDLLAQ